MSEAAARPSNMPGNWLEAARAVRFPFVRHAVGPMFRNIRFVVPACIILICGCFAAAALVQMRLERAHAQGRIAVFARDRAATAGATLDRFARMGAVFAASPQQYRSAELGRAEPAIRDIAVFDDKGALLSRLHAAAGTPFAVPAFAGTRALIPAGLAVREKARTIAVLFDAKSLAGTTAHPQPGAIAAPVPGWPLFAVADAEGGNALLPLTLFSGTFFPLSSMPIYLQWIGWLSPIWHGTQLARIVSYGAQVPPWLIVVHVLYLFVLFVPGWLLARRIAKRRLYT